MKRMRNRLPSAESQNPFTFHCLLPSIVSNKPSTDTSLKGFAASGDVTRTLISIKSYASTEVADALKDTLVGIAKALAATKLINVANRRTLCIQLGHFIRFHSSLNLINIATSKILAHDHHLDLARTDW